MRQPPEPLAPDQGGDHLAKPQTGRRHHHDQGDDREDLVAAGPVIQKEVGRLAGDIQHRLRDRQAGQGEQLEQRPPQLLGELAQAPTGAARRREWGVFRGVAHHRFLVVVALGPGR
jgi:hypothetical protein